MHPILRFAKTDYISAQHLMPLLTNYSNPRDFISRLVKQRELIRLKNGFFVISEKIENSKVPYEQIANLLYGPSYVSFEWALSHYGMIPEGVYVVTSATISKSVSFKTPLATFDYIYLGLSRYIVGIDQASNQAGNFLIATPEKALADLVHLKSKNLNENELLTDLIEARRIEENYLKNLNKQHLLEIAESYRSKAVTTLTHALGLL
jgi:predicted transcriptional regulator of viral defense system